MLRTAKNPRNLTAGVRVALQKHNFPQSWRDVVTTLFMAQFSATAVYSVIENTLPKFSWLKIE